LYQELRQKGIDDAEAAKRAQAGAAAATQTNTAINTLLNLGSVKVRFRPKNFLGELDKRAKDALTQTKTETLEQFRERVSALTPELAGALPTK